MRNLVEFYQNKLKAVGASGCFLAQAGRGVVSGRTFVRFSVPCRGLKRIEMKKIYRPNVAVIVLSAEYPESKDIFIAARSDLNNVWQFPQGGIDEGESAEEALFRELEEEIGTSDVTIISEYPEWISYDFPSHVAKKMKPYAGQTQRYYLVRLNEGARINLDTHVPEFSDHKFVGLSDLSDYIAHFKRPVYEKVLSYFKEEGFF